MAQEHIPEIVDLKEVKPDDFRLYFLDANVWLLALDGYDLLPDQQVYVDFWNLLLSREQQPSIVMNAVLSSELINRYQRIGYSIWLESQEGREWTSDLARRGKKIDYKLDYRFTSHYRDRLTDLLSDLEGYAFALDWRSDSGVAEHMLPNLGASYPIRSDFNDAFHLNFCKHHELPLVTHDGDFYEPGTPVLTNHWKLLKMASNLNRGER